MLRYVAHVKQRMSIPLCIFEFRFGMDTERGIGHINLYTSLSCSAANDVCVCEWRAAATTKNDAAIRTHSIVSSKCLLVIMVSSDGAVRDSTKCILLLLLEIYYASIYVCLVETRLFLFMTFIFGDQFCHFTKRCGR